jgi:hypothetical protein
MLNAARLNETTAKPQALDGHRSRSQRRAMCGRCLRYCAFSLVVVVMFVGSTSAAEPKSSPAFGFLPVEVFKLTSRSSNLVTGDFNHDGRSDLVLIDNSHHRLDLLIQRVDPTQPLPATDGPKRANEFEPAGRFEHRKLPVDQDVAAVCVGDFDSDGRDDLAYFGNPDQLVIRFQPDDGTTWTRKQQLRLPDVAAAPWCVASGDLNHDNRDDIVVLGKNDTAILLQPADGKFAVSSRLLNTSDKLGLVQAADINGDGRDDLCYMAGDALSRALCVRLQDSRGQLGPETAFDLERPRSVTVRDVDGKPGQEILTIDVRTNRLKMLRWQAKTVSTGELPERLVRYGFGQRSSGRDRDLTLGDFDGNGLVDVAVTDPEASRVLIFRQWPGRGLDLGVPFPSPAGADIVRSGVFRANGPVELVVHSGAEKSIGVSAWRDERLQFPTPLPLDVEPLGLELWDVDGDTAPEIVFLTREKDNRESQYTLRAYRKAARDETFEPVTKPAPLKLSLKSTPERLQIAQLLGDLRPELMVFQGNRPPVIVTRSDAGWEEVAVAGSLGSGTIPAGATFPTAWNEQPGLLVGQDNFARHLRLNAQKRWEVTDQVNAGESGANIAGAAVLDLDGVQGDELVLVDAGVNKLRILRRSNDLFAPAKELDLGAFKYQSARVADFNGDRRDDLLLVGDDQFAVLSAAGETVALDEVASYETTLEKTFPTDVAAGDLNGDGRIDLAVTETRQHYLEILEYQPLSTLSRGLYFTIFEEKGFAQEVSPGAEPREAVIADVTGDGRSDLILLVHDRVLVYPQDDGTTPALPAITSPAPGPRTKSRP